MNKEILKYLQRQNSRSSIEKIAEFFNSDTKEAEKDIKILRDDKLVKATDGWDNQGKSKYTNIEITTKGVKFLEQKEPKKSQANIKVGNNNGIISVGDQNTNRQDIKNNPKESLFSKFFWWVMGIVGAVIAVGIIYYFGWK